MQYYISLYVALIAYEHGICLPVRPSVTMVDCDHTVQQKVENGQTPAGQVGQGCVKWLPARSNSPGSRCLPYNTEEDKWVWKKCIVLYFGGNNLRNGASYASA